MIVDGVNFSEKAIKGMSLKAFTDQCIGTFWPERDKSVRRKILQEVWETINPPAEENGGE